MSSKGERHNPGNLSVGTDIQIYIVGRKSEIGMIW